MARPARPERSRSALPLRQLSRFCYLINSDMVFGTHNRRPTINLPNTSCRLRRAVRERRPRCLQRHVFRSLTHRRHRGAGALPLAIAAFVAPLLRHADSGLGVPRTAHERLALRFVGRTLVAGFFSLARATPRYAFSENVTGNRREQSPYLLVSK